MGGVYIQLLYYMCALYGDIGCGYGVGGSGATRRTHLGAWATTSALRCGHAPVSIMRDFECSLHMYDKFMGEQRCCSGARWASGRVGGEVGAHEGAHE